LVFDHTKAFLHEGSLNSRVFEKLVEKWIQRVMFNLNPSDFILAFHFYALLEWSNAAISSLSSLMKGSNSTAKSRHDIKIIHNGL